MIYDCFTFDDEFELLEVRLHELAEVVDKFVLVQGNQTFTGQRKPYHFKLSDKRFAQFRDKIIDIHVDLSQATPLAELPYIEQDRYFRNQSVWSREFYQRNAIKEALQDCKPNDVIIISDVDEIPTRKAVKSLTRIKGIVALEQQFYYHYFNCVSPQRWYSARAVKCAELTDPQQIRDAKKFKVIKNAGWHFTNFGTVNHMIKKINSFSHQEYNTSTYRDPARLQFYLDAGLDIYDRPIAYQFIDSSKNLPGFVLKNTKKFKKHFADLKVVKQNQEFREKIVELQIKTDHIPHLEAKLTNLDQQLQSVLNTRGWKLLSYYRDRIKPMLGFSEAQPEQSAQQKAEIFSQEFAENYLQTHPVRKLHIGCGSNIIDGWLNSDLHEDSDRIILDATKPFPFPDETFDYVYSEHTIEHLDYKEGQVMLAESFRVLKKGGKIRTATPNMRFLINFYNKKLTIVQKKYIKWAVNEFMKDFGKNMPAFVVNNFVRSWGHKFIYDQETLKLAHRAIGFGQFKEVKPGQSADSHLRNLEKHWQDMNKDFYNLETMILEATKPGRKIPK